jgi:Pyruvate/2-oxoacid:ferredoxin oxidoreductase gamma subunit
MTNFDTKMVINNTSPIANVFPERKLNLQILICGIGGQGGLHLGHNLARLVADRYQDIFSDEIRGIAQKRASVTSMIRCGNGIRSAFFIDRNADYVLALEPMEIMRLMPYIGPSTICILLDTYAFVPLFGICDLERPSRHGIETSIHAKGGRVIWLEVEEWLKSEKLTRKYAADIMAGAFAVTAGYTLEEVKKTCVKTKNNEEDKKHQHAIVSGFVRAEQQLESVTRIEPSAHLHSVSEERFTIDKSHDVMEYETYRAA